MRPILAYADTSVYGGVFDDLYREATTRFFRQVDEGRFRLAVSPHIEEELRPAPSPIRDFFARLLTGAQWLDSTPEVVALADAYLAEGILGPSSRMDALHVATATVHRCSVLVSWNFRHIVQLNRADSFNVVNIVHGHSPLFISTPKEVSRYADRR